jgi:hypothetical protein
MNEIENGLLRNGGNLTPAHNSVNIMGQDRRSETNFYFDD